MKILRYCLLTITILAICAISFGQNGAYDYSIEQRRDCYCLYGDVWVKLFVRADTIADAITIPGNLHLPNEQRRWYKTIKGLSDEMSNIDTLNYSMHVTMDSSNNYPSYLSFGPKKVRHGDTVIVILDAWITYSTRNYIKLK